MKITIANSSLTAMFIALYAVGVVGLAPISFQLFQIRIADCLLPLTILFGPPAILGLGIGCFIANLFGGLGPVDIVGGSIANLVAGYMAWQIGKIDFNGSWFLGTIAENIIVTLIVGTYLAYLFGMPIMVGWLGVFLGSLIAINFIGYLLLKTMSNPSIIRPLMSRGLKLYVKGGKD